MSDRSFGLSESRAGRFRGALLGLALFACDCSAEQVGRSSHGIETPLGTGVAAAAPSSLPPAQTKLDFRSLDAFLSAPGFENARAARIDGQPELALEAYQQALGKQLIDETLSTEAWFQLGLLRRDAGKMEDAAAAFERAAQQSWRLTDYARYFAATAFLAVGKGTEARPLLEGVDHGLPFSEGAELALAQSRIALGERDDAIAALRKLLARDPRPQKWAEGSLLLAQALLSPPDGKIATQRDVIDALDLARSVALALAGTKLALEASEVEHRALSSLSEENFNAHQALTTVQERVRLEALVEQRQWEDALVAANELLARTTKEQAFGELDCEVRFLHAKALAGDKAWGKAVDQLTTALERCKGDDLTARLHFVAGKFAQIDKRYSAAIRIFEALEKRVPDHRLADDARLRRAQCYLELGDEAKYTELLSSVTEDYPEGDVALDGLFQLAVRRVEKGDWSSALNLLERAAPKASLEDPGRDHEFAGRERYFRARALIATGEKERGLAEYEALVAERPLSYYMLHSYSRLFDADPLRARAALTQAVEGTEREPFAFPHRPEFESDAFQRALVLARHGEIAWAERELSSLPSLEQPELLWSIALVYGRTGAAHEAHVLARGRLTDWLSRWPVGDWRAPWELAFPRPFLPIVERVSAKQEVPQALIYAVMREESAFRPEVVSPADAFGLMQLIKPTAKHFGTKLGLPYDESALRRPSVNIALGAAVLGNYGGYFPNDPLLAIPGYNAGPGRPKRWRKDRQGLDFDVWVETIPFTETRRYTKRVLASRGAYSFLYVSPDSESLLLPSKFSAD